MRAYGKIAFILSGGFILCLAVAFVSLVCFEHRVPDFLLKDLAARVSTSDIFVSVESASFSCARGVRLNNVRVFDRHRRAADPVAAAERVDAELGLSLFSWNPSSLVRALTVTGLKYPRLPEGYYIPDSIEFPGRPDFQEKDEPLRLDLPEIKPFRLTLVRPDILSVTPRLVTVERVSCAANLLEAEGVHLRWADADTAMSLAGGVQFDLDAQRVRGEVRGRARQHNIRPMLVALDITNSYAFIDSFTRVEKPIDASCAFDVNLRNNDLHLRIGLRPEGGFHNKVPLRDVTGTLDIRVFVRDTFQNARIVVGPLTANLADGRTLGGTLVYENTNDVGTVDFDVRSTTSLSNALAIADVLRDGTLDSFQPESPTITLKGRLAVDPANAGKENDLSGTVAFARGTLFSIPLRAASGAFRLRGTTLDFTDARAEAPHGGRLSGDGRISMPEMKSDRARFAVNVKGEGLTLKDLADVFSFDLGDKHGTVNGAITLEGPVGSNVTARLNGKGRLTSTNGHLGQMKLFAGLTDWMAKNVPGVSFMVNQSRGSLDFTMTNGVFATSNLLIEGGLFAIRAKGTYDIPRDDLDFSVRLTITKNDTFLSTLATPIRWPFANLTSCLFGFKVTGPIDAPKWTHDKDIIGGLRK